MAADTVIMACCNKDTADLDTVLIETLQKAGIDAKAIAPEDMPPGSIPSWISHPDLVYAYILVPAAQVKAAGPILDRAISEIRFPVEG